MPIPVAQGRYVPAIRHENLIFVSGMTPRDVGVLKASGAVEIDRPVEGHRSAVELAMRNSIAAAKALLLEGERLEVALSLTVFVNSPPGYTLHSKIADIASRYLQDECGVHLGIRAAVGTSSLPGGATIEVSTIFSVSSNLGA